VSSPRWLRELGAALWSPLAALGAPRRTWGFAALYLAAATVLLAAVGWAVASYWTPAKEWALAQLVPPSWRFAVRWAIEQFLAERERLLAANAIATGGLLAVTLLLFPLKELVSTSFERGARLLGDEPIRELPLWEQAWQEAKLLAILLAAQGSLFWLGLLGGPTGSRIAAVLGALVLCAGFAIDFAAPILQRHQGRYSQILKLLAGTPLASLAFGALFAAPSWIVARLWAAHPEWSTARAVLLVFAGTVVGTVWAALAGTWFGARLYPRFCALRRSRPATRAVAWLVVLAVLAGNGWAFGALARSLHHKSQILNCTYRVDPRSLRLDTSSLPALLDDEARIGVTIDVAITNPTTAEVAIENNRLELRHRGDLVATARLRPLRVPAGASVVQTVGLDADLTPSILFRGRDLLRGGELSLTLWLELSELVTVPIALH
jgi:hypothetical protein